MNTVEDFWQMIWQEETLVIVMTTNLYDGDKEKCYPYWKANEGETVVFGNFEIATLKVDEFLEDFTETIIEISNLKVNF